MTDPAPWERVSLETWPDMNYLLTEEARARYVLAAHYVRECDHLVEIGGFKTPITAFVTRVPRTILVVDPKIEPYRAQTLRGAPCRVEHARARFQERCFELPDRAYALVILGVSLKYFSDDPVESDHEWGLLAGLVRRSRLTVLEFGLDWHVGSSNVERIVTDSGARERVRLDLDMSAAWSGATAYTRRRFLVLEPEDGA